MFELDLKACEVLYDITSDGKLFRVYAAATKKAQSPIAWSRVGGRASSKMNMVIVDQVFERRVVGVISIIYYYHQLLNLISI